MAVEPLSEEEALVCAAAQDRIASCNLSVAAAALVAEPQENSVVLVLLVGTTILVVLIVLAGLLLKASRRKSDNGEEDFSGGKGGARVFPTAATATVTETRLQQLEGELALMLSGRERQEEASRLQAQRLQAQLSDVETQLCQALQERDGAAAEAKAETQRRKVLEVLFEEACEERDAAVAAREALRRAARNALRWQVAENAQLCATLAQAAAQSGKEDSGDDCLSGELRCAAWGGTGDVSSHIAAVLSQGRWSAQASQFDVTDLVKEGLVVSQDHLSATMADLTAEALSLKAQLKSQAKGDAWEDRPATPRGAAAASTPRTKAPVGISPETSGLASCEAEQTPCGATGSTRFTRALLDETPSCSSAAASPAAAAPLVGGAASATPAAEVDLGKAATSGAVAGLDGGASPERGG